MKQHFLACLALTSLSAMAHESSADLDTCATSTSDWQMQFGLNYRSFGDFDFKSLSLGGGGFLNGSVTDYGGGQFLYQVDDPQSQISGANLELVNFVQLGSGSIGGSDDVDDGIGTVLKFSKVAARDGHFSWGYDFSFTTAFSDSSMGTSLALNDVQYNLGANWNTLPDGNGDLPLNPPPGAPASGKNEAVSANNTPITVDAGSRLVLDYDLDLGVYTFGAGLNATWEQNGWSLFAGAGPALSIVDYDLSLDARAVRGDQTVYSESQDEDDLTLRFGGYAEAGVYFSSCGKWGLGAAARYDWVPVELNNSLAELDLSGLSGQFFVQYNF